MRVILLGATLLFSSNSLAVDDLISLAEDTRNVLHEVDPIPSKFYLSEEEADKAQNYAKLDREIDRHTKEAARPCDSKKKEILEKIAKRKKKIMLFAQFSDKQHKYELSKQRGIMGGSTYEDLFFSQLNPPPRKQKLYSLGSPKLLDGLINAKPSGQTDTSLSGFFGFSTIGGSEILGLSTIEGLEEAYLRTHGIKRSDWQKLDHSKKIDALGSYLQSQTGVIMPSSLLSIEYIENNLIKNPSDWKDILNGAKNELSFDDKIKLASRFGDNFESQYNFDRIKGGSDSTKRAITVENLLQSVQDNTPGGICRDIALAQSKMLKELGVPKDKIYIVSYQTPYAPHAALIVQDPKDKNKITNINYSVNLTVDDVSGPGAVVQYGVGLPDTGIAHQLYNYEGKPVAKYSNEIGQILKNVTGNKSDSLITSYDLQRVEAETDHGRISVFSGKTSNGETIVGGMLNKSLNYKYINVEGGVGSFRRNKSNIPTNNPNISRKLEQDALYSMMKLSVNTPQVTVKNVSFKADASAEAQVIVARTTTTLNGQGVQKGRSRDTGTEFNHDITLGATANYTGDDQKTTAKARIESSLYRDFKNVADASAGGLTWVRNNVTISGEVERELDSKTKAILESALVLREVGNSTVFKAGLERSNVRVMAGYQTPLDEDAPSFIPGLQSAVSVSVEKPSDDGGRIEWFLEYSRDLDVNANSFKGGGKIYFN